MITRSKTPKLNDSPPLLADDLLFGAKAIGEYIGLTPRQVFYRARRLGLKRLGTTLVGSKQRLYQLLRGEAAA